MPYKENCKVEGHILTRFKIARHYFHDHISQVEIAQKISCHRNTVGSVVALCKNEAPEGAWKYLKSSQHISADLLENVFSFLLAKPSTPHAHPTQLRGEDEAFIIERQASLGFGAKRLYSHLKRSGENMTVYTLSKIRGVYKRNNLKKKTKRTINGNRRALYNYSEIGAFEHLQYDTKDILDQKALPIEIYNLFKNNKDLPRYQWTIIDAKTRTRFLAWSHNLNSWYGFTFLVFVIHWLRAHGHWQHIQVQVDGGSEFCSSSEKKLTAWNKRLAFLNASVIQTEGVKWKQNLVERSHRSDDEEFYVPRGYHIKTKTDFLVEAQQRLLYWNCERENSGIYINNRTPELVMDDLGLHQGYRLARFPVLVLDDLFEPMQVLFDGTKFENAQKDLTHYRTWR